MLIALYLQRGLMRDDSIFRVNGGNDSWVEQSINDSHACLIGDNVPSANKDCDYCSYRVAVEKELNI